MSQHPHLLKMSLLTFYFPLSTKIFKYSLSLIEIKEFLKLKTHLFLLLLTKLNFISIFLSSDDAISTFQTTATHSSMEETTMEETLNYCH